MVNARRKKKSVATQIVPFDLVEKAPVLNFEIDCRMYVPAGGQY